VTPTVGASSEAIAWHYDAGNAFYALWLDESLTYSCGLFAGETTTLGEAQERKLMHHADAVEARADSHILDVGCGWGSMLSWLHRHRRAGRAVGLTLSRAQAEHVAQLALPRTEVRVESWEAHVPRDAYDGIVTIGAFEHFASPSASDEEKLAGYRRFFRQCHGWLRPGGRLSLQSIVYENATRAELNAFIRDSIFPESDLPRAADLLLAAQGLFELRQLESRPEHYVRTLRSWLANLRRRRAEAVALVGEETVKRYERYFQLSMIGFHTRRMGLCRATFQRLDEPRLP
jgi:cyclopropane-fatty-acyl-phospholipid synthase